MACDSLELPIQATINHRAGPGWHSGLLREHRGVLLAGEPSLQPGGLRLYSAFPLLRLSSSCLLPQPEIMTFVFVFAGVYRDRVSLRSPGCPRVHWVNQAGLDLREPPTSVSRVLH